MKLLLCTIGKGHEPYVREGVEEFSKRISRYYPVEWTIIAPPKNAGSLSEAELRTKEAALALSLIKPDDYLIALDERGKMVTSEGLAQVIQQRATESTRNVIFLIGGAYGLAPSVLQRANFTWSLSQLTFPHQLVRLILAEQIYRACSILRNEKYHHR
jgi:23S rRNA (pseudouridine1915-N3)-methyltransferase